MFVCAYCAGRLQGWASRPPYDSAAPTKLPKPPGFARWAPKTTRLCHVGPLKGCVESSEPRWRSSKQWQRPCSRTSALFQDPGPLLLKLLLKAPKESLGLAPGLLWSLWLARLTLAIGPAAGWRDGGSSGPPGTWKQTAQEREDQCVRTFTLSLFPDPKLFQNPSVEGDRRHHGEEDQGQPVGPGTRSRRAISKRPPSRRRLQASLLQQWIFFCLFFIVNLTINLIIKFAIRLTIKLPIRQFMVHKKALTNSHEIRY